MSTDLASSADRFRRATIDFLLTVGEVDALSRETTVNVIAELIEHGVDYEHTATPTFGETVLDESSTDHEGLSINAFATEVVPNGAHVYPDGYRRGWTFYVPHKVLAGISFPELVARIAADDASGTRNWKDRYAR